jgi:hypothetical protein
MPVAPCNSLKTLTIEYSTSSIMPSSGYTIQWRVVGDEVWYTEPNKRANPIVISGVPSCFPLEVKLLVDCGNGLEVVETFGVQGSGSSLCYEFELLDTAQYSYTPCGGSTPVSIYNTAGLGVESLVQTVCAIDGSVTGGRYTRSEQCLGNQF